MNIIFSICDWLMTLDGIVISSIIILIFIYRFIKKRRYKSFYKDIDESELYYKITDRMYDNTISIYYIVYKNDSKLEITLRSYENNQISADVRTFRKLFKPIHELTKDSRFYSDELCIGYMIDNYIYDNNNYQNYEDIYKNIINR